MLTAIEDLLDSWPGTLIVVSHDRYLVERVTDQQYAVMDGHLRHLPGGVEEFLRLRGRQKADAGDATIAPLAASAPASSGLGGAEKRAAEKELSAVDRKIAKLQKQVSGVHQELADHDQSDYEGLGELTARLQGLESEVSDLETRWLELSEQLE